MNAKHAKAVEYKRSQYAIRRENVRAVIAAKAAQAEVDARVAAITAFENLHMSWHEFVQDGLTKFISRKLANRSQSHNATAAEAVCEAIDLTELWIQHHPEKGNRSRANAWVMEDFKFGDALELVRLVEENMVMAKKAAREVKP